MNANQRSAAADRAAEVTPEIAGRWLKAWIAERNLVQEDLVAISGEARSTISRMSHGQSKALSRVLRVLAALDLEVVPRERVAAAKEVA